MFQIYMYIKFIVIVYIKLFWIIIYVYIERETERDSTSSWIVEQVRSEQEARALSGTSKNTDFDK